MQRKLHIGIERYLNAAHPFKACLTVKDTGNIRIIGKANTVSRQLADIANMHTLGNISMQDVFENEPNYAQGLSKAAM